MKTIPFALLLAGAFWVAAPAANSQISNDEASMNFLAIQCAVSGNRSDADYSDYGRKLARTIGLLDPSQQERVFGFLPQPTGTGNLDLGVRGTNGENRTEPVSGVSPSGTTPNAGSETAGSTGKKEGGGLSETGTGTSGKPETGSVGETGVPGASAPEVKSGETWIDDFVGWLRTIGEDASAYRIVSDVAIAIEAGIVNPDGTVNRDSEGNVVDGNGNIIGPGTGRLDGISLDYPGTDGHNLLLPGVDGIVLPYPGPGGDGYGNG